MEKADRRWIGFKPTRQNQIADVIGDADPEAGKKEISGAGPEDTFFNRAHDEEDDQKRQPQNPERHRGEGLQQKSQSVDRENALGEATVKNQIQNQIQPKQWSWKAAKNLKPGRRLKARKQNRQ